VQEKGLRDEDPFDEVVARARVFEFRRPTSFEELASAAAATLAERSGRMANTLESALLEALDTGFIPISKGVALPHARIASLDRPILLMARCERGLRATAAEGVSPSPELAGVRAVFFLMSPEAAVGQHLRLLGHLATQAQDDAFLERWMMAPDPPGLKATLLRAERWISLTVGEHPSTLAWPRRAIRDVDLPPGALVALVRREGVSLVPNGSTVLEAGDFLTVIGHPSAIRTIASMGVPEASAADVEGRLIKS
jgi:mannitol/fructose-specific phosphotransferase system IIA component (Ntr-type)